MFVTTLWPIFARVSSACFQFSADTSRLYFGAAITQNSILAPLVVCDFFASKNACWMHLTPLGFGQRTSMMPLTFTILTWMRSFAI